MKWYTKEEFIKELWIIWFNEKIMQLDEEKISALPLAPALLRDIITTPNFNDSKSIIILSSLGELLNLNLKIDNTEGYEIFSEKLFTDSLIDYEKAVHIKIASGESKYCLTGGSL